MIKNISSIIFALQLDKIWKNKKLIKLGNWYIKLKHGLKRHYSGQLRKKALSSYKLLFTWYDSIDFLLVLL